MARKITKKNWGPDDFSTASSEGPEIWEQSNGQVNYLFAGLGTGGTIIGIGRYLKEKKPSMQIYGVEPTTTSRIPGLKNCDAVKEKPSILNRNELNGIFQVTEKEANEMTRKLAAESSLLVGPSSGAVLCGILKFLKTEKNPKGNIVTVFPDSGQKYLSKGLFSY